MGARVSTKTGIEPRAVAMVALLRGINVGGHKTIKMADLVKAFEGLGLAKVRSLLASGNVVFETAPEEPRALRGRLEGHLAERFGHPVGVVLRFLEQVRALAKADPFHGIELTPDLRFYVTFLPDPAAKKLKVSSALAGENFQIAATTRGEICSVARVLPNGRLGNEMNLIEKEFGKDVTTRNWNTVLRIAAVEHTV